MTAKEASELSDKNRPGYSMDRLMEVIEQAARIGKNHVVLCDDFGEEWSRLTIDQVIHLREQGYEVEEVKETWTGHVFTTYIRW